MVRTFACLCPSRQEFHSEFISFAAHCGWHNCSHPHSPDISGFWILVAIGRTASDVLRLWARDFICLAQVHRTLWLWNSPASLCSLPSSLEQLSWITFHTPQNVLIETCSSVHWICPPTFCNTHHTHIVKLSGHSPVETLHDSAITQHSGFLLMWTLRCSLSLDQNGTCLSFAIGEVTDYMLLEEAKLNSVALQVVLLFHCQDKQWLGVPFCTRTAQWAITYRQNTSQWEIGMIISSFT